MESINTIEEITELFKSTSIETVKTNLKNIISQLKMLSNPTNKKNLKLFFKVFLDYIINNSDSKYVDNILKTFHEQLIDLGILFQTETNEFFQSKVSIFEELEKNEILNLLALIVFMTTNLNQTNQILSNLITQTNKLLSSIEVDLEENIKNFEYKSNLIYFTNKILMNIKSYNPYMINQLESLLYLFTNSNKVEINESIHELLETVKSLIISEDINNDIIFGKIVNILSNNKFKTNSIANEIIKIYREKSIKLKSKKSIQINFLTIKRKPIQELEPEIEGEKRNMTKILETKLKKTKKEAIRNLKKEARVIDSQRQQVLFKQHHKRKEEQKSSNQFIEQTNIEYKKLMTSQDKKRFKLKHNRK